MNGQKGGSMRAAFRKQVRDFPLDGGKRAVFYWSLVQFGRVVAEGVASSPDKAEAAIGMAMNTRSTELQLTGDVKKEHRKRIRRHLLRRTHVTLALVRGLMAGAVGQGRMVKGAAELEKSEWDSDTSPDKKPLTREGRGAPSLPAGEVVKQLIESMWAVGFVSDPEYEEIKFTGKGRKWALEMFSKEEFGLEDRT